MSTPYPHYDCDTPYQNQDSDFDCSQESAQWCLRAWGRAPDDGWMTQCLIDEGVMTPEYGLMDASGAGMASWFNRWYGSDGYVASNEPSVSFDDVASEAGTQQHPLMMGGRAWCHWVGVSDFNVASDLLIIKNSANGYLGVYQTLNRTQWANLGPFSMVRLTHPAAEGLVPPPEPEPVPPTLDYSPWIGLIGSGLLDMLRADNVLPAQSSSTWLPLGTSPADVEECIAESGVVYRWLLTVSRGFRYRPQE